MASIPFSPLNDFSLLVNLAKVNPVTGAIEPLTTGAVDHFMSNGNDPATAAAADPSLAGTATYTGVIDATTQAGIWLIQYDAAALTAALLATQFGGTAKAYLIIKQTGGFWTYIDLKYVDRRKGTVVV
jgi:hypothetical protein